MIKVYSKENCAQCVATQKYLDKKEIEYRVYKIDDDSIESVESLSFVKSLGYQSMPVVFVSSEKHWSGFRPDLLGKL